MGKDSFKEGTYSSLSYFSLLSIREKFSKPLEQGQLNPPSGISSGMERMIKRDLVTRTMPSTDLS